MSLLAVDHLSSGYAGAVVLREVSLAIAPGEILAVLGKNGMGKSTLLKAVMGFLPKMTGTVAIAGGDATRFPRTVWRGWGSAMSRRKRRCSRI